MIKLILVVAAIPLVLIGSVRLALRVLRFVRENRGEVTLALLQSQVGDAFDSWLDHATATDAGAHADGGGDHHHHSGDDGSHHG